MNEDRRSSPRVPFSEEDGVICILTKPEAPDPVIPLQVLDISEHGIKFATDPEKNHSFSIWEKLHLRQIIGTRIVTFTEPIELVVRWQENGIGKKAFGCEITRRTTEAGKQFARFVESERSLSGAAPRRAARPVAKKQTQTRKEADQMAVYPQKKQRSSSSDNVPVKFWALVAVAAFFIMTLASVFITYQHSRTLSNRLNRLEMEFKQGVQQPMSPGKLQTRLASIDASILQLKERVQQNQNARKTLEAKIETLQTRATGADKGPAAAVSSPLKEKPVPVPSPENAPGGKGSGSFHVVQKGENLYRISLKYNIALNQLAEINDMAPNDTIYPGQKIKLP